jgi:hypothetical protein
MVLTGPRTRLIYFLYKSQSMYCANAVLAPGLGPMSQ